MRLSLSVKILLLVAGSVAGLAALNAVTVTLLARQEIGSVVRADVRATGNGLAQTLRERSLSLDKQVQLLARQPALKGYIQAGDKPTLQDLAADYSKQMGAAGVALTDRDGKALADTLGPKRLGEDRSREPGVASALNESRWSGIVSRDGHLMIAVTEPIVIGPAVWGTFTAYGAIDSNLAAGLSGSASGSQIAFVNHGRVVGASLLLPTHIPMPRATPRIVTLNHQDYFALYAPFPDSGSDVSLGFVVLRPYGAAMSVYNRFLTTFLAVSALFLLIALIAGSVIARGVTRPLSGVVEAARQVKSGEWPAPFALYETSEIGLLQSAFDEMTLSMRQSQEKLLALIDIDPLTGLDNHRRFQERLIHETKRAAASGERLSLLLVSFDHFSQYNQKHGHAAGDAALQWFSASLTSLLPEFAVCARYGGDEFAILLPRQDASAAVVTAETISEQMARRENAQIEGRALTLSIGCAEFGLHSSQPEGLNLAAQLALLQAKQLGRNRVCRFDSVPGADKAVDPYQLYEFFRDGSLSTIQTLAAAVDAKDPYTRGHSQRVAEYASALAAFLGQSKADIARIEMTGTLHDVGKIGVPDAILSKPGRLTDEERAIMETHPVLGEEIVRKSPQLAATLPGVRHHHERWDGRGYPDGLAGEAIPFDARILAVADTFDAMTSDRPYRRGLSVDAALDAIGKGAGTQFDPALSAAFIAQIDEDRSMDKAA